MFRKLGVFAVPSIEAAELRVLPCTTNRKLISGEFQPSYPASPARLLQAAPKPEP
jgi:hypothetical protein